MPTPTFPDLRPDQAAKADPIAVRYLQQALISQGYTVKPTGKYDNATIGAVMDFQATHLDSKGTHLLVDGWVGKSTWWAIQNPSGAAQISNIDSMIRKGLSVDRKAILRTAFSDHARGVKEVPDGANYGDGVTRYLEDIGPAFWCCAAVSTWHKDAKDAWPFGTRFVSVAALWKKAGELGRAVPISTRPVPCPGDAFVFLYRNSRGALTGLGHIGLVAATAANGVMFNTVEGNVGNRVKVSLRDIDNPVLVGFVDFFGDRAAVLPKVERGLFSKSETADSSLAGTR